VGAGPRRAFLLFAGSILILLAVPVQGALPLANFAKEIIKQVVKDFVQSQLGGMQGGIAGMQGAAPLSGEEVDELVTRLAALSKAMPDQALPCSPEELKLVFNMSASMPMGSAPLRMMLEQFRAMDQSFKEVRETFARMSSAEQAEAIDLMLADSASMSAEERKQLAGFLQSDLFGLPAAAREQLRARLGSVR
jgi:hypothetical protein